MWKLFKVINLLYLLLSTNIWFAFLLPRYVLPVVFAAMMVFCFAFGGFRFRFTSRAYGMVGILIAYLLYQTVILGFSAGLWTFMAYLPAILIFALDIDLQKDLLFFVTKWVCIIMGVSLGYFILHFVIPLPHVAFLPPDLTGVYTGFDNYGLFLENVLSPVGMTNVVRFCGPFLEPGHQSLMCCLLLFANRYSLKKNPLLWILVVSILMSFSLAGYVIFLIGFLLVSIRNIYYMVALTALVGGSWLFVTDVWQGGNNPVNMLIVQRLEYDKEKGVAGNNRTAKVTDYFYKASINDGTIWMGVRGSKRALEKIKGAGYKVFLLRYGIWGLIFVSILYLSLIPKGANVRYSASFVLIIILVFLQRAYPDWYSWLLPYVLGIGISRGGELYAEDDTVDDDDGYAALPIADTPDKSV